MLAKYQFRYFEENGFRVVENILDRKSVLDPLNGEYELLFE